MNESRRLRRMMIPDELIPDVLNGRITLDGLDLPADVRVLGSYADYAYKGIGLILESEAFALIELGVEIPLLPPFRLTYTKPYRGRQT